MTLSPVFADKKDAAHLSWYTLLTLPRQEGIAFTLLQEEQREKMGNLLEVYFPRNPNVLVHRKGRMEASPLLAGRVFVLTTARRLMRFIAERYPDGRILYDRITRKEMVIPEPQMRCFMDFNDHYADDVFVLERPYSDYAFNAKTGVSNEMVRVMDGPFAGLTGYLVRFRSKRRLVFRVNDMAVSIPYIWDYRLTRLHNPKGNRQLAYIARASAVDLIVSILHASGFRMDIHNKLRWILETLTACPSLNTLCKELEAQDRIPASHALRRSLETLTAAEASQVMGLAYYIKDEPSYLEEVARPGMLRPFLTPTALPGNSSDEVILDFPEYTEYMEKVTFPEDTYNPRTDEATTVDVTYYAHVGRMEKEGHRFLFANWDRFLAEYFLITGEAKEKQLKTFAEYAPTFHGILTGQSRIRVTEGLRVEDVPLNALTLDLDELPAEENREDTEPVSPVSSLDKTAAAIRYMTRILLTVCLEISRSTHLALWRRSLRTVWLHR